MNKGFKAGQLIVCMVGDRCEIGKIKRICNDGKSAFVNYHSGETAAKTSFDLMYPIDNESHILSTSLGGYPVEPEAPVRDYIDGVPEDSMAAHYLSSVDPDSPMGGWGDSA